MFDRHLSVWPELVPQRLLLPKTNLYTNLAVSALRYPDVPALIYYGAQLSYQALDTQVQAMAGYLQSRGVKAGDRVLLFMQNSPQFVIGFYAILRANAVVVPVNPMNRHAELEYLVQDTQARVMLCGAELAEHANELIKRKALDELIVSAYSEYLPETCEFDLPDALKIRPSDIAQGLGISLWQDALAAHLAPSPLTAGPDDLAVIPYSSGTTGNPKGCMHTHHSVMATAVYCGVWGNMQQNIVQLVSVPMFHVTGMQVCMNSSIYLGASQVIMTRWDRKTAAQLIERYKVSSWRNIPTMVVDLLSDTSLEQYDLSSLKSIGGGGAAMPAAVAQKLESRMGLLYSEGYGLSETMSATHMNPPQKTKIQCLGIPIIGVDSRVIDVDTLTEVAPGVTGEIIIRGEQLFAGYWRRPEETDKAFIEVGGERFFRTGDLGYYDEEGYFFLVDRVKRMINASGFKVWPAEVEALMYAHPGILEVCIIASPDAKRGETVKAVVVKAQGHEDLTEQAILAWCQEAMSAYKCPKSVEFVQSLPKSPTGKIMWRALQELEYQKR